MAPDISTSQVIDKIISLATSSLKSKGFKKIKKNFYLPGDLIQIINFQNSIANYFEAGKFTINLYISCPYFHEKWTGTALPNNPLHLVSIIRARIGDCRPDKQDYWWNVSPGRDIVSAAQLVEQNILNYAIPFLTKHSSINYLLAELSKEPLGHLSYAPPIIYAGLLGKIGRYDEAVAVLDKHIEEIIEEMKADHFLLEHKNQILRYREAILKDKTNGHGLTLI